MPIYEYVCLECQHKFESIRSIKDSDAAIQCDNCQSNHTKRCLSLFYAKSGGQLIAGKNSGGCSGCSANSCSGCGH